MAALGQRLNTKPGGRRRVDKRLNADLVKRTRRRREDGEIIKRAMK